MSSFPTQGSEKMSRNSSDLLVAPTWIWPETMSVVGTRIVWFIFVVYDLGLTFLLDFCDLINDERGFPGSAMVGGG